MTSRALLIEQIADLSEIDATVLLALVRRLRDRAQPAGVTSQPAPQDGASRPNTAPLAGSIHFMGDVESPIDERWDAES